MLLQAICKSTFCGWGCNCSYWKVRYLGHVEETSCGVAPCSLQIPPEALSQGLLEQLWFSLLRNAETTGVLSRKETEGGRGIDRRNGRAFKRGLLSLHPLSAPQRSTKQLRKKDGNKKIFFSVFPKINKNNFTFVGTSLFPLAFHPSFFFFFVCCPLIWNWYQRLFKNYCILVAA